MPEYREFKLDTRHFVHFTFEDPRVEELLELEPLQRLEEIAKDEWGFSAAEGQVEYGDDDEDDGYEQYDEEDPVTSEIYLTHPDDDKMSEQALRDKATMALYDWLCEMGMADVEVTYAGFFTTVGENRQGSAKVIDFEVRHFANRLGAYMMCQSPTDLAYTLK